MNSPIYLMLLFYSISTNIPIVNSADMDVKKGFDIPTPNTEEYVRNGKHYTAEGNLFFAGQSEGYSDEFTLFFKKESALCTPHFKIRFCLEDVRESMCENGITLCYDSKINAEWNKKEYQDLALKVRNDLNCSNKGHHGIMVYTDNVNGQATQFKVKASIDKHNYIFPIPKGKQCFDLNMGSNNSLATSITDIFGKKLIYVGAPPADFKIDEPSSLFYKEKSTMNLWMLFIDFMPFYLSTMDYKPRKFQFTGGGEKCRITATFDTESINVCRRERELIGACEAENLDSSDLECRVELRASQSVEEGREKQTGTSVTDSESNTEGKSKKTGESSTHEWTHGLDIKIGKTVTFGIPLVGDAELNMDITIKNEFKHASTASSEEETSSSFSKTHETSQTKSFTETHKEVNEKGKTVELKIHRTDGGTVNLYQEAYTCAGQIHRFHKIVAEGDKQHAAAPQSTVVYEKRKEVEERNTNSTENVKVNTGPNNNEGSADDQESSNVAKPDNVQEKFNEGR